MSKSVFKSKDEIEIVKVHRLTIEPEITPKMNKLLDILENDIETNKISLHKFTIEGAKKGLEAVKETFGQIMFEDIGSLQSVVKKSIIFSDDYTFASLRKDFNEFEAYLIDKNYEYNTDNIYPKHMVLVDNETGYVVEFGTVRFVSSDSEVGKAIAPLKKPLDSYKLYTGEINKETWNYINKKTPEEIGVSIKKFYDEYRFIEPEYVREYAPNIYYAKVTALTECEAKKTVETVERFTSEGLPPESTCKKIPKKNK